MPVDRATLSNTTIGELARSVGERSTEAEQDLMANAAGHLRGNVLMQVGLPDEEA